MSDLYGKRLLFVGGGEESAPGIHHAQKLGIQTVVMDRDPGALGMTMADASLVGSIFDVEGAVGLARIHHQESRIDGVVSVATDAPRTVSAIARALGLSGMTAEAARLVSDKLAMKQRFLGQGIPTAPGHRVGSAADIATAVRNFGGTAVLKPVDSLGARGVSIVESGSDHARLFSEATEASPTRAVLIEKYLSGPQFSTESIVCGAELVTVAISTRNYGRLAASYPYPVEDGGDLPAELAVDVHTEMNHVMLSAAQALGIQYGTIKGDLVVHGGRVRIIELAGRLSGGYLSTHMVPLSSGVDLLRAAFEIALGIKINLSHYAPKTHNHVAQRYIFPEPGRVVSVQIPRWARSRTDINLLVVRIREGDVVPRILNHPARAGLVITTGPDRNSAIRLAESVIKEIIVKTEPV
jgi:biotin carboxylase